MKSKLNTVLTALGFKQHWHVCWVIMLDGQHTSYGDGTFTFTPKLSKNHIEGLRVDLAKVVSEAVGYEIDKSNVNITGLIRIGS